MERNEFLLRRNKRKKRKEIKLAIKRKNKKKLSRSKRYLEKKYKKYHDIKKLRKDIKRKILNPYKYNNKPITIQINTDIGLELIENFDDYIEFAKSIVDSNSKNLKLDMINCNRFWPSAIALVCSLKKWMELACKKNNIPHPKISSNTPKNKSVETYLIHSGFYDYVGRDYYSKKVNSFKNDEIVKIKRETDKSSVIERERELDSLIKKFANLTEDEYELFICKVLPEITNNVTEHGESAYDQGWWILGQYHRNHKIISICIADNGIGIKQSLLTGPQKNDILDKIKNKGYNDNEFIELAFKENISGAYGASKRESGIFKKKFEVGAKRGHGLKRILATCIECNATLTIVSHYGYIRFNSKGEIVKSNSSNRRLFAGTLYHITLPTKEII